jgi:hypothetical protein
VVGFAIIPGAGPSVTHAVLWPDAASAPTDLGTAGGSSAVAMGIDASGAVFGSGTFTVPGTTLQLNEPVLWAAGSASGSRLPTTTPSNAYSWGAPLTACSISAGVAVGYTSAGGPTEWTASTASALGGFGLADYAGGYAEVVNPSGRIACNVLSGTSVFAEHLFVWHDGAYAPLPSLPGGLSPNFGDGHCNFSGIDGAGDIVGDHWMPGHVANVAALWTADGHVYDLNHQLTGANADLFWSLGSATGIDDDGLITGMGFDGTHWGVFLLTPVAPTGGTTTGGTSGGGTGTSTGADPTNSSGPVAGAADGSRGCGLGSSLGLLAALAFWRARRRG